MSASDPKQPVANFANQMNIRTASTLPILFAICLGGSLFALWMANRGVEVASQVAMYLGLAAVILGFAMFFVQVGTNLRNVHREQEDEGRQ
jgi:hypothetical protein